MLDQGYHSACGIVTDGRLICWGDDEFVAIVPEVDAARVSLGTLGGCVVRSDGGVTCWCMPSQDRACRGVTTRDDIVDVQAAEFWACAEDVDHVLHCWGSHPMSNTVVSEPVTHWDIEADVGCAVMGSGAVECWGDTDVWQGADPPGPLAPPEGLKYTQVAVGRTHACALDTDGEVHCWGKTGFNEPYPQAPPGPFVSIESWHAVTCGLRPDHHAACWWDLPGLIDEWSIPDEAWAQLGLGEWDGCGLTLDGRGLCFGVIYDSGVWEVPDLEDL
ncbi:MAG: RCC1 domain-containing protein [Myxococcota bacterium]